MPKQSHFVVCVNEDGSMFIDYDISINFDSGSVWNEETEEWEDSYDNHEIYEQASERLTDLLMTAKESEIEEI